MTITTTNFRLDKKIGGFDFDFQGFFFVEKREKQFFGLGDEARSCRIQVGAGQAMALMYKIE